MAQELSEDECLVRDWLRERGYTELEHEPAIITNGRRPDFLATTYRGDSTPNTLWAEVKSLEPDNTVIALSKSWPVLKELGVPENINGHAMLHVTKTTRAQSVGALLKMFYSKSANLASENVRLIFIQQRSEKNDVRYVEVHDEVVRRITSWARERSRGI